jgi:amidohydrolase
MDALPIHEATGAEYASQLPGRMHACGHDGHTAIGLTVARMLHTRRDNFIGTVKFVFQPAEEGMGGAERMIQEGVLENPRPDIALGLHIWNEKPYGTLMVTPGPFMAAGDLFDVRISGKGGHGALPHQTVDTVMAAAQVISALQSIVSRNVAPLQTAVVTVAAIHGGEAFNVIPPHVDLKGTLRSFEPHVRSLLLERFEQIVNGVADAFNCSAEISIQRLTPAVINNPAVTASVQQTARRILPECDLDVTDRTMGSEDMAFFLQEIPGCFFFVGSANPELGLDAGHHHPRFDFDERVLSRSVALMTEAALDLLGR